MDTTAVVNALDVVIHRLFGCGTRGGGSTANRSTFLFVSFDGFVGFIERREERVGVCCDSMSESRWMSGCATERERDREWDLRLCSSSEYSVTITFTTGKTLMASVASKEFSTSSRIVVNKAFPSYGGNIRREREVNQRHYQSQRSADAH
jgi:hypothetical protein